MNTSDDESSRGGRKITRAYLVCTHVPPAWHTKAVWWSSERVTPLENEHNGKLLAREPELCSSFDSCVRHPPKLARPYPQPPSLRKKKTMSLLGCMHNMELNPQHETRLSTSRLPPPTHEESSQLATTHASTHASTHARVHHTRAK